MPKINTIEQTTTPGGGLGAGPNARAQEVYDPSRALGSIASSVNRVSNVIDAEAEKKKNEADKAQQEEARYQGPVLAARLKAELDEKIAAMDEVGGYVDSADRTKKVTELSNNLLNAKLSEASANKYTQNYLKAYGGVSVVDTIHTAVGYEAAQNVMARVNLADEAINTAAQNIASDPSSYDQWLTVMEDAALSKSKDPATQKKYLDDVRDRAKSAFITRSLATDPKSVYDNASALLGGKAQTVKMSEADAASKLLALQEQTGGEWTTEANNKFMSLATSGRGYNVAVDNGKVVVSDAGANIHPAYADLTPEDAYKLMGQAEAILNRKANDDRDSRHAAAVSAAQTIQDSMAAIGSGDPSVSQPSKQEYITAANGDVAEAEIKYREDGLKVAAVGKIEAMNSMDATQRAMLLESMKPKEGEVTGRATKEGIYRLALEANAEIEKQLASNPGDFVASKNKQVIAAQKAFAEDPSNLAALQSYVSITMDAQDKLGVRKKTLPTGLVDSIATAFTSGIQNQQQGQAESSVQYLIGVGRVLKNNQGALAQLVNKTGTEGMLAINGASPETVQLYMQAKATKLADHEKATGKIGDIVDGQMAPINATWIAQGALNTKDKYSQAVELIAHARIGRGESPEDAVRNAYNDVIGSQYEIWGKVRVPKKGAQDIKDGLDYVRQSIISADNLFIPPSGSAEVDKVQRETLLRTIRRGGYWINDGTGDGAYLVVNNGQQVLDASGQRIYASFDNAAKRAIDARKAGATQDQIDATSSQMRRK